jgi:Sec-independent protein translocase protein TatA
MKPQRIRSIGNILAKAKNNVSDSKGDLTERINQMEKKSEDN